MATPTIKRQLPTRVPGNMGDHETFCDLADADAYLNFRNGEALSIAPTRAKASESFTNKNVRLMFNEGRMTPDGFPKHMRTMFGKNSSIDEVVAGSKPFNEYTQEECYRIGPYLYNAKGGFGFLCGEAQENEGPWKFQSQYAAQQMKWTYEGITKFGQDNPTYKIINGGLIYASDTTIWPGKTIEATGMKADYQTIKNGYSSVSAARSLLAAYEWDFHRFWGGGLFETGAVPLVNAYYVHNDNQLMYWKTVMQGDLNTVANQGVFLDPHTWTLFLWDRAKELQPYTETYVVPLGNNLSMIQQEFCTPNPNCVYAMNRFGFSQGKYVINWDNPYMHGTDPNTIPETGDRIGYQGSTAGRNIVSNYNPGPFAPNTLYAYANAPFGYNDLSAIAGKDHCRRCDFLNKRPGWIQFSVNGVAAPAPDAGHVAGCIDNQTPHSLVAVDGNRATIEVYQPNGSGGVWSGNLGGSFGNVSVELWPGIYNEFFLQI